MALGDGTIDLLRALELIRGKSNLDRLILEIPVEEERDEAATLEKEDDFIQRSVGYARDVLKIC